MVSTDTSDSKPSVKPLVEWELIGKDEPIHLARVINPFDPREVVRTSQPHIAGMTVASQFSIVDRHFEYVVSLNGKIIEEEDYATTEIHPGDYMVICPVPTGGGGGSGKNVLRMIAMIAVVVVANIYMPGIGASMGGFWATSAGTAALVAGATMVGTMVVNALLPVKPAQSITADTMGDKSSSYGIDGAKNASQEGLSVPICYGTHRMGGNVIGLSVENVDSTQLLYMLLNAGEGPIANISDIELNDQPIDNYKDVEWQSRLGLQTQDLIPWFDNAVTARNLNIKLDTTWTTYLTPGTLDRIRCDFVAPSGLFQADRNSGALKPYTVPLEIQYRKMGDATWLPFQATEIITSSTVTTTTVNSTSNGWTNTSGGTGGTGSGTISLTAQKSGQEPVYSTNLSITDSSRSAVRRSFTSPLLANGRYEVRVRRQTPVSNDTLISDVVFIGDINEMTVSKVTYKHTALLDLKVKLTDQLNGVPTVTYKNHGRIIKCWNSTTRAWEYKASSNPAWIAFDMLTHLRYGGQLPEDRIDIEGFKEWGKFCDDQTLEFNGVFDSTMNIWDAIQYVLRIGHAQLINIGTRHSVAIEKASTPVMMFGVGNMKKGTFNISWLPMADRANEVAITFFDEENKNKQKTIKVYDPVILTQGRPQRSASITLFGCTDELTAVKEAILHLNLNRYILQTCEFEAPIDALACTVGSLIYIQHDMPNWETSGRTESASTNTVVKLDRPVTMVTGQSYKAMFLYEFVNVGIGTISAVDTNNGYLSLSGYSGAECTRITIGGVERRATPAAAGGGVYVDNLTGISIGDNYALYNTDVVIERDVVNTNSTVTQITVTSALNNAPAQFTNFMFGPVAKVKRPFRVKAISMTGDSMTRKISCVQYDERAYTIDSSGYATPTGVNPTFTLSHVRDVVAYEETYITGGTVKTKLVVQWRSPLTGIYKGADVYLTKTGQTRIRLPEAVATNRVETENITVGEVIKIKVNAFDMRDARLVVDDAPEITYTVTGRGVRAPDAPRVTGTDIEWTGRDCRLYWRLNSQNTSYDFGSEPYGGDSGSTDPTIEYWEVTTFKKNLDESFTQVRKENVTSSAYIYTYEKNSQDGLNRSLKFEVRVRPKIGNLGAPAVITASNPQLPQATAVLGAPSFNSCAIGIAISSATDYQAMRVYLSQTNPVPINSGTLVYDGPNTVFVANNLLANTDYFVRVGQYDSFGPDNIALSNQVTFKTLLINATQIASGILGIGLLDATLATRIGLIDANASVPGSVAFQVAAEATARASALLTEAANRTAAITTVQGTLQTNINSQATRTDTLRAALVGVGSSVVQDAALASMTAAGGSAQQVSTLGTRVSTAESTIVTDRNTAATATATVATNLATLNSQVNNATTGLPATRASFLSYQTTSATDIAANATNISTLSSQVNNATTGLAATLARVITEETTRATAVSAEAGRIDTIRASLVGAGSSAVQNAALATMETAGGAASQISTVQTALVGAGSAAVQTAAMAAITANGGLSAQYTVKIDINGYVSGFGLASTAINGVPTSTFTIRADSFKVVMPSYPTMIPFAIGAVAGVPKVIIDSAVIGDATIGTAAITDANITTLKVGGNQITVPASISGFGIFTFTPGSTTTVASVTIDWGSIPANVPAQVNVMGFCQMDYAFGSGGIGMQMQLWDGGSNQLAASNFSLDNNAFSMPCAMSGSAPGVTGFRTYELRVYNYGARTYSAGSWSLVVLGTRR
jgi:predicted phage tail protein